MICIIHISGKCGIVWEDISKTRASCFIIGSKHRVLSVVFRCLKSMMKYSHSLLIYFRTFLFALHWWGYYRIPCEPEHFTGSDAEECVRDYDLQDNQLRNKIVYSFFLYHLDFSVVSSLKLTLKQNLCKLVDIRLSTCLVERSRVVALSPCRPVITLF